MLINEYIISILLNILEGCENFDFSTIFDKSTEQSRYCFPFMRVSAHRSVILHKRWKNRNWFN